MSCGGGHGGHGGHFLHKPDNKDSGNESSLGLLMIMPFLIGLVIFCGIIIFKIGTR